MGEYENLKSKLNCIIDKDILESGERFREYNVENFNKITKKIGNLENGKLEKRTLLYKTRMNEKIYIFLYRNSYM